MAASHPLTAERSESQRRTAELIARLSPTEGITLTARIAVPKSTPAQMLDHANRFNQDQAAVFMFGLRCRWMGDRMLGLPTLSRSTRSAPTRQA